MIAMAPTGQIADQASAWGIKSLSHLLAAECFKDKTSVIFKPLVEKMGAEQRWKPAIDGTTARVPAKAYPSVVKHPSNDVFACKEELKNTLGYCIHFGSVFLQLWEATRVLFPLRIRPLQPGASAILLVLQ